MITTQVLLYTIEPNPFQVVFSGDDVPLLLKILNRYLNTLPEADKKLFELADVLDKLMRDFPQPPADLKQTVLFHG